jgi:zinc protease
MKRLAALLVLCAATPAQDIFPYKYHIDDLPNGLRLITIPTDFPHIVAMHIIVKTGSRNEIEKGRSGFAHFFEHMMFRGTKNYTPKQRAALFKEAGADRNAYTTDDYTNYHTTFAKEDLEKIIMLEADRFRYLSYGKKVFRTESLAVFGEYNKNSSNPITKMFEVIRDKAFQEHTYKHTTMGFLRDIVRMPRMYDYSQEFFRRWYKPEYTTILVVGDIARDKTLNLVKKHWGDWERGEYKVVIPREPEQTKPLYCHVEWNSPTQPWIIIAFKGPAFDPGDKTMPTLDVLSELAFSSNSDIYKKLFVRERKVNSFWSYFPDHKDPFLLMIGARVKKPEDVGYVRDEILKTCARFKKELVDEAELAKVKSALKYGFAGGLDSSEAIASSLSGYIARTGTPETVNKVYRHYDRVTPEDIRRAAQKYFVRRSRTIATLSHEQLPILGEPATDAVAKPGDMVLMPSRSPLVSVRLVCMTGAAKDPRGKEGLAYITAQMLTDASTRKRSYEQIIEDLFPMAAGVGDQVDKEMTVFYGTVHRDNLEKYYALLKEMLLEPGFKQEDLDRIKSNTISYLDVGLRRTNDEETGKEVMYEEIYQDHPYGHLNAGAIEAIQSISLEDVKQFYNQKLAGQAQLVIGLAGGYPRGFPARIARDLERLQGNAVAATRNAVPSPQPIPYNRMTIVQKKTRATGIHVGFPIPITRRHKDWPALWLVRSYFGEHRSENSYLYQRLREIRGLNYGDYAYIEYFPHGGSRFHPAPNLGRSQQIFQIWIRPVPPENGPFAFKAANYELRKLVKEGISKKNFEATRTYLSKFANLLVKTQDRQLGYALDSRYYGIGSFPEHVKESLAKLTVEDVNAVIRKYLRADRLQYVVVTEDAEGFRDRILSGEATPITYRAEPPQEILDEDKVIEKLPIDLKKEHVKIVPVDQVFGK